MGWGSREPPEPAKEEIGVKPALNAGSPQASAVGSSHSGLSQLVGWVRRERRKWKRTGEIG